MLVFFDESFRSNRKSSIKFGVLAGIAIPEDRFHIVQRDIFNVRIPYHGVVLEPASEIKGKELLGGATFKVLEKNGYSYQWNLATELLQYCARQNLKVFGVVCFKPQLHSFVCGDENRLDATYRHLFERVDHYMKLGFPGRFAKLVFDNRDNRTNEANARAITNFFVRSTVGLGYDSILRIPMFAASQGHNYGLQLADLITTVVALRFQGENRVQPLWRIVRRMLDHQQVGSTRRTSLRVMRHSPEMEKGSAAVKPIAGANPPSTEPNNSIRSNADIVQENK